MADAGKRREAGARDVARAAGRVDVGVDDAVAIAGDDLGRRADFAVARRQRRDRGLASTTSSQLARKCSGRSTSGTWVDAMKSGGVGLGANTLARPERIKAMPIGIVSRRRNGGPTRGWAPSE